MTMHSILPIKFNLNYQTHCTISLIVEAHIIHIYNPSEVNDRKLDIHIKKAY